MDIASCSTVAKTDAPTIRQNWGVAFARRFRILSCNGFSGVKKRLGRGARGARSVARRAGLNSLQALRDCAENKIANSRYYLKYWHASRLLPAAAGVGYFTGGGALGAIGRACRQCWRWLKAETIRQQGENKRAGKDSADDHFVFRHNGRSLSRQ